MDKTLQHVEEWYVIFRRTTLKHWIFALLDDEIQHCYAVKDCRDYWLVVDGKNCCLQTTLESKADYPHIRCFDNDSVILSVRAIIDPKGYRYSLCLFSCVDVVKAVLGVKDFWCWTPYQLYRGLTNGRWTNQNP